MHAESWGPRPYCQMNQGDDVGVEQAFRLTDAEDCAHWDLSAGIS